MFFLYKCVFVADKLKASDFVKESGAFLIFSVRKNNEMRLNSGVWITFI